MSATAFESWFSTLSRAKQDIFNAGMSENETTIKRQTWRLRSSQKWIRKQNVIDFCVWETRPEPSITHGNASPDHRDALKRRAQTPPIVLSPQTPRANPSPAVLSEPVGLSNPSRPATSFEELLHDLTQTLYRLGNDTPVGGQDTLLLRELTVSPMNFLPQTGLLAN